MAANQYTLNQLIQIFQAYANAPGGLIKSFFCGNPAEYKNPSRLYPLLYISPTEISYSTSSAERIVNFER